MNGIISKWVDPKAMKAMPLGGIDNYWNFWQRITNELADFFTKWTKERANYPIDFQYAMDAGDSPQSGGDYMSRFNYVKGKWLQLNKEIQVFIFDKWDPMFNTPERTPDPLNTGGYTDAWGTVVLNYIPPQISIDYYRNRQLSLAISLELWHLILHRQFKPFEIWETRVHDNYLNGIFEEQENGKYLTLGGSYE